MSRVPRRQGSEFSRIDGIAALLAQGRGKGVLVGIGDDAAVLRGVSRSLVWTCDSSVEGVHFRRDIVSMQDVGWRSYHAAVSDIAAMGADVIAALSALELPPAMRDRDMYALVDGQALAAKSLGCPLVGGNLSRAERVAVTTSVLGSTDHPLLRSGARIGDEVWLVGKIGMAAAGLACLLAGKGRMRGAAVERCVEAFRRPEALVARGKLLNGRATAVIDISDGLAGDARHIAESSRVSVELSEERLMSALSDDLVAVSRKLKRSALSLALFGGEDYALLATGPRERRPRFATRIGVVTRGVGVSLARSDGKLEALGRGFEHFGD